MLFRKKLNHEKRETVNRLSPVILMGRGHSKVAQYKESDAINVAEVEAHIRPMLQRYGYIL